MFLNKWKNETSFLAPVSIVYVFNSSKETVADSCLAGTTLRLIVQTQYCLESEDLPSLFDLLDDCLEPFVRVIAKMIPTAKIADSAIKRMPFLLVELTTMVRHL